MSKTLKSADPVPYFTLTRQNEEFGDAFKNFYQETVLSGKFILGKTVENFENHFAAFCASRYAIGVGSGTDALIIALRCLGIGKGDEVIVPSFTFVASVFSILHAGATPVFADIDEETYGMDPDSVARRISRKTKAIMPVHLYGQCVDMDRTGALAKRHKLAVIEDAAQAHGASWKQRNAGSMGDMGCFSFYPTKNLGAFGDGGLILTQKTALAHKAQQFRNLGRRDLKGHLEVGMTSRLDAVQAGILDMKLNCLARYNEMRRSVASMYRDYLAGTPLILPVEGKNRYHVYHLFVARVPGGRRAALRKYLAENGIPTLVHYDTPCHRQPAIQKLVRKPSPLPVTEKVSDQIVSLPMFPEMKENEVARVAGVIKQFYKTV